MRKRVETIGREQRERARLLKASGIVSSTTSGPHVDGGGSSTSYYSEAKKHKAEPVGLLSMKGPTLSATASSKRGPEEAMNLFEKQLKDTATIGPWQSVEQSNDDIGKYDQYPPQPNPTEKVPVHAATKTAVKMNLNPGKKSLAKAPSLFEQ